MKHLEIRKMNQQFSKTIKYKYIKRRKKEKVIFLMKIKKEKRKKRSKK